MKAQELINEVSKAEKNLCKELKPIIDAYLKEFEKGTGLVANTIGVELLSYSPNKDPSDTYMAVAGLRINFDFPYPNGRCWDNGGF
tara:strand:- start:5064 stop:5321 length:258 start_codon:yes stop_codon:yes gene_type:complete